MSRIIGDSCLVMQLSSGAVTAEPILTPAREVFAGFSVFVIVAVVVVVVLSLLSRATFFLRLLPLYSRLLKARWKVTMDSLHNFNDINISRLPSFSVFRGRKPTLV